MIHINKSQNADSRTSGGAVAKEQLLTSSQSHIGDVIKGMDFFAHMMMNAGAIHDNTKISGINEFHHDFVNLKPGAEFKAGKWWKQHAQERHHLNDFCPRDVNLVDVIEMLVDCVMAGMARSGTLYEITVPDEVLKEAVQNTVNLLREQVVVLKDGEQE